MRRTLHVAAVMAVLLPALADAQSIDLSSGGADQIWAGTAAGSAAGAWLDQGGVSVGDNRRDLIVGAPGTTGVLGHVYVIFGGGAPRSGNLSLANADVVITGATQGDGFGFATAAGNIWNTEDSIPRALVVGAPYGGSGNAGRVYLFRGGFEKGANLTTANALFEIRGRPGDLLGYSIATADLNNDGYREMVLGAPGNNRVYIINGGAVLHHSGTTQVVDLSTTSAHTTIHADFTGTVLSAGDVTGDDIYDVMIAAPAINTVYVIKGRSGPLPADWQIPTQPADITLTGATFGDRFGAAMRIADIDGDQSRDLIIGAPGADGPADSRADGGEVYVFTGPTMMQLAANAAATRNAAAADITFFGAAAGHRAGAGLTAGDINRDSPHNDLVIYAPGAAAAGEWLVYYGRDLGLIGSPNGAGGRVVDISIDGQIDRRIVGDPARGQTAAAQVFEVTGEGARDIVVGVPTADSGAGAVFFTISPRMRLSDDSVSVRLVVNAGQSSAYLIRVQNSSTVPITWRATAVTSWLSTNPSVGASVAGNDGTFYVIASAGNLAPGTYTGTVMVSSTSRDLEMSLPVTVTMQVAPSTREPGDFSGDGSFDIIWQHDTQGWLAIWKMNGTTLQQGESLTPDRVADTNWKVVGTGDFNGDGHPDLLWRHADGWLAVWHMNGTRQISGVAISPDRVADPGWQIVATGDFNGDGRRDIVWQHATERHIAVWLMNGAALLEARPLTPNLAPSTEWRIAGSADFNGDGHADLLWHNQATGGVSVAYMRGTTMIAGESASPASVPDTNWKIRAVGDLNKDGKPDLLWQHIGNGSLAVWFMNDRTQIRGVLLEPSSVADLGWRIVGPK